MFISQLIMTMLISMRILIISMITTLLVIRIVAKKETIFHFTFYNKTRKVLFGSEAAVEYYKRQTNDFVL